MTRYLVERLLALIPTLLGVSVVVFLVIHLIPGDVINAQIGTQFQLTEEQAAALRRYFGVDKPLHEQYFIWLASILRGDFGYSVRSGQPVLKEILTRFPLTLQLTLMAGFFALLVGVPVGILSATRPDSAVDLGGRSFALVGLAMPNFWVATLVILVLSLGFGWLPNSGAYVDLWVNPLENLKQLVFPALVLGLAMAASVMRTTRSSMLEVLGQDYIRTARGKGLREGSVINGHGLKNALIPVITIVGVQLGYLLGGAFIVEEVFALPGIGRLVLTGISNRDYAVVQGAILFIAVNFVLINLAADLLYRHVDPRIRYQ